MPPSIIDKETSTDMVVREASNATLICKAAGYPEPYVMWRREDGDDINYNGDTGKINQDDDDGQNVMITRFRGNSGNGYDGCSTDGGGGLSGASSP